MKFRTWLLLMVVLPIMLTSALLTTYFVQRRLSGLEDDLRERGFALARQVSASVEYGLFAGNRVMIESVAAAAMRNRDVDAVVVRDQAGTVMARLGDERAVGVLGNAGFSGQHIVVRERVRATEMPLDDLFADTSPGPAGELGSVVLVLSTESLRKARADTLWAALIVAGSLSGLAIVLVLMVLRSFGARLVNLSEAVAKIGAGDMSQVPVLAPPSRLGVREIDTLTTGIDAMSRQIAASHRDLAQRVAEATAELERRRDDAERANNAKSRFLAAASHDLRQPLHALGLFADQLSRRPLSGEDARLTGRIVESAGALSDLLDSLLDISRLDAGAMAPKMAAVELGPLFGRMAVELEGQAANSGLRLRVRPTRIWVMADPMMLERILINLMSNALRYTERGTVMLAARRAGPGQVRIEVRDSGIGIPEDAQRLVFDEFVQLGNPERDRRKGLGLGLSIVQRMCQLMGFRFGLRSRPGLGSVFWVQMASANRLVVPEGAAPGESAGALGGRSVWLIDDDRSATETLVEQLRAWGGAPDVLGSGSAMANAMLNHPEAPAVVLAAHCLRSGETGVSLVRALRAHYGAAVPAVILAADGGGRVDPTTNDDLPVLTKPLRPARLRAVLQGLIPASGD